MKERRRVVRDRSSTRPLPACVDTRTHSPVAAINEVAVRVLAWPRGHRQRSSPPPGYAWRASKCGSVAQSGGEHAQRERCSRHHHHLTRRKLTMTV